VESLCGLGDSLVGVNDPNTESASSYQYTLAFAGIHSRIFCELCCACDVGDFG
jgi:hypothetical protein